MSASQETIKKTSSYIKSSATLKVFSIGILVLILLIPASMISFLINERESRKNSVVNEISSKWGSSQTITGPFITIPYKNFYKDANEKIKFDINYLHILPETLNVSGEIKPEVRYRSLYEAVLYNTTLNFNGAFKFPSVSQLNIEQENILWGKAVFSIGITDLRGIQDKINIKVNESTYDSSPGLKTMDIASSGVGTLIKPLSFDGINSFSFVLNLNGSEQLNFIPVAETNIIKLNSSWPSPSFNGAFLPTSREVTDNGFSARWKVLHLNRNYPQYWSSSQYKVEQSAFGLKLILTADVYQKATRISKYAIMFIVFTFSAFFFSEIINKRKVHPIQYSLIGLAILLFYTLLLSLSEYINFNYAYIASAAAITLIITCYSYGIIKNKKFAYTILGILIILYSYLFIVLQLEDYALIMGNIGLLIILATVMYITRKIDWYAIETE
ncbi:MAG: cell envelope integrity protein CreD [Actinobacteria bacterium]|nr:cell envelope integrity protein CreD [Actinomycetota bacterium]